LLSLDIISNYNYISYLFKTGLTRLRIIDLDIFIQITLTLFKSNLDEITSPDILKQKHPSKKEYIQQQIIQKINKCKYIA